MGGSTTTTSQSNQQQVQQLPPWINDAAQQNYAFAQNVANRPLQQYQGQMVADVAPQQQQGWNVAAQGGNAGADQYNASQAGYLGVLGQQPQQVTAGQLAGTDLSPYMNPYTQSVINATLPIYQQNLGQQQMTQQQLAAQAGAYGGSRQGIQQGVTQAQGAQGMAQMAQQLNQANFDQAQKAAQQDIAGRMQAALANQTAQNQAAATNVQAAGGLAALGNAAQTNQARNFTELMSAGADQRQVAQAQIDAQMKKFSDAWGYPTQQLGALQSALGMTPYGTATQGQTTGTQEVSKSFDPAAVISSGLMGLGSLFSAPAGGVSAATGMANFFGSDRRMKTDITKVGMHPAGVPLYSYRYKADPKTYPKVIGPMAEDVAKIAPHAVAPIPGGGGKMMVHTPTLNALAGPMMGRGPPGLPAAAPGSLPGALSAAGPMGGVGPLGAALRAPPAPRVRARPRAPAIKGALGGL